MQILVNVSVFGTNFVTIQVVFVNILIFLITDFAGPEPVVSRGNIICRNVPDVAGKFKLILIIALFSLSIMIFILISHVELK